MNTDCCGLLATDDPEAIDSTNRQFYARFPFPRPPLTLPRLEDPAFETVMLNQSIGDYSTATVPANARIWIAGCGTNQAVYTGLRFPRAAILGSDLSPVSLDLSRATATSLGLTNLEFRQESLNHVTYREEFDYILCTGVIHHNADPACTMSRIARALRPGGVLELMVYNRFHRAFNAAFATAVRIMTRYGDRDTTLEEELAVAKSVAAAGQMASSPHLAPFRTAHESHFADALIQPVEYSYTVASLDALLAQCGLALMLPCYNQFDRASERAWTLAFDTSWLQQRVDSLPDRVRWEIANLLLMERSPFLWFYARHRDDAANDRYEMAINEEFLDRAFVPASTALRNYVRQPDASYALSPEAVRYPLPHPAGAVRDVVDSADGRMTMREILERLGQDPRSSKTVTDIRVQTTTSLCPHLRAV